MPIFRRCHSFSHFEKLEITQEVMRLLWQSQAHQSFEVFFFFAAKKSFSVCFVYSVFSVIRTFQTGKIDSVYFVNLNSHNSVQK